MQELNRPDITTRTHRTRIVAYWIVTVLVAFELVASFIWVLVGTQYVTSNLAHLGYPPYFPMIPRNLRFPGCRDIARPALNASEGVGLCWRRLQILGGGRFPHVRKRRS
jgi:hypothetical protein